jgi:predicted transglutaminase-like cysteine proteinase
MSWLSGAVWLLFCALLCAAQSIGFDHDAAARMMSQRFGSAGLAALQDWEMMIAGTLALPEDLRLKRVNEYFNRRIHFEEDARLWGEADYWATPMETLGRGAGDCEDFSLAKYFTLRQAGVPEERMRLTYVRARIGGSQSSVMQAHMVLAYYSQPDAEPLILDNLITDIRSSSRRGDLFPVFSFNAEGLWVGKADSPSADAAERLSRWRDLLRRTKREGFQ